MPPNGWIELGVGHLLAEHFSGEWGLEPVGEANANARVLRATNLVGNSIDYETAAARTIPAPLLVRKELRDGDLLLEASGGSPDQPVGRVARFSALQAPSGSYVCSNFFRTLRVREDVVTDEYAELLLQWLVRSPGIRALQRQTTGIINLDFRRYLTTTVRIPKTHDEQREIVGAIHAGAAHTAAARDLAVRASAAVAALRQELFGKLAGEPTPLGSLFEISSGDRPPGRMTGRFPLIGANGPIGKASRANVEDVLIVGRVGAAGQVHRVNGPAWASDNTLVLRPRAGLDHSFAHHLLLAAQLHGLAQRSVQPLVTQTQVGRVECRLPAHTDDQETIGAALDLAADRARSSAAIAARAREVELALRNDLLTGRVRV